MLPITSNQVRKVLDILSTEESESKFTDPYAQEIADLLNVMLRLGFIQRPNWYPVEIPQSSEEEE